MTKSGTQDDDINDLVVDHPISKSPLSPYSHVPKALHHVSSTNDEDDVPSMTLDEMNDNPEIKKVIAGLSLSDVVTEPTFNSLDPVSLAADIIKEFNKNVVPGRSCFTRSIVRGEKVDRNQVMLGHLNRTPEMAGFSGGMMIARSIWASPKNYTEAFMPNRITDQFYGLHGSYVLNVQQEQYALAYSWNTPKIYRPGVHVIHDANFRFDQKTGFCSQNSQHIKHGNINILYVPANKIAKIKIGSVPYVLVSRATPYVFVDPLFSIVKKSDTEMFFDQNTEWIQHESINILYVPAGRIAAIKIGSVPYILKSKATPYVFIDPVFTMYKKSDTNMLYFATDMSIINGCKKRVIVPTGKVLITYNNGSLEIYEPSANSKPIIITSETHEVKEFLDVTVQTLQFPSETTKKERKRDLPNATAEEISYEMFTTRDSLKVGVKVLVAFRISDPYLAISILGVNGIVPHIENLANTDLGKAIQKCSSQEFLSFNRTRPTKVDPLTRFLHEGADASTSSLIGQQQQQQAMDFQDMVKEQLAKDLSEYGIELIRLNIESPKIMDPAIATKMAEQSIKSAESNAQETLLAQQTNIANQIAQREAQIKAIQQEQENRNKLSQAQTELDAASKRAEAVLIEAKANKEAALLRGQAWEDNILLYNLEMEKIRAAAIGQSNFLVSAQAMIASNYGGNRVVTSPFDFFGGNGSSNSQGSTHVHVQGQGGQGQGQQGGKVLKQLASGTNA